MKHYRDIDDRKEPSDVIKKADQIHKLSPRDKQFLLTISNEFEVQPIIMEGYLRVMLDSLKESFQHNYMIGRIDYRKSISKKRASYIKYHSQHVLGIISLWEIPKFRKCIIAALVLMHFKLDRNIKTKEEFDIAPTDSAKDYHHYLYYRMKNRFK